MWKTQLLLGVNPAGPTPTSESAEEELWGIFNQLRARLKWERGGGSPWFGWINQVQRRAGTSGLFTSARWVDLPPYQPWLGVYIFKPPSVLSILFFFFLNSTYAVLDEVMNGLITVSKWAANFSHVVTGNLESQIHHYLFDSVLRRAGTARLPALQRTGLKSRERSERKWTQSLAEEPPLIRNRREVNCALPATGRRSGLCYPRCWG